MRNYENVKTKWIEIDQDMKFIKSCKKEHLALILAKVNLSIKSGSQIMDLIWTLIKRLEHDRFLVIECFENNNTQLYQDKCHLLISGYKNKNLGVHIGNEKIWESNMSELLGLDIDRNLNFNEYISSLCKKEGNKLSILARLKFY